MLANNLHKAINASTAVPATDTKPFLWDAETIKLHVIKPEPSLETCFLFCRLGMWHIFCWLVVNLQPVVDVVRGQPSSNVFARMLWSTWKVLPVSLQTTHSSSSGHVLWYRNISWHYISFKLATLLHFALSAQDIHSTSNCLYSSVLVRLLAPTSFSASPLVVFLLCPLYTLRVVVVLIHIQRILCHLQWIYVVCYTVATWTPLFLDRTMDYTVSWHSLSIVSPCVIKPHTSFSLKSFFVVNYIK